MGFWEGGGGVGGLFWVGVVFADAGFLGGGWVGVVVGPWGGGDGWGGGFRGLALVGVGGCVLLLLVGCFW